MLLFIFYTVHFFTVLLKVSIHLMLLFINDYIKITQLAEKFQYISCCYLSSGRGGKRRCTKPVSIHLMLLFIECPRKKFVYHSNVSIHLMLLFIGEHLEQVRAFTRFNTSHVVIYQKKHSIRQSKKEVSIHLMLLFIELEGTIFQYCACFNTSHVVIYP